MDSLIASPVWTEHFNFEVGEIQPSFLSANFETPFDLYHSVRELVALGSTHSISHPWLRSYPPLQALQQLFPCVSHRVKEPFIPTLEKPLPIAISCQVALLWALGGYRAQAAELAATLEPLIQCEFTSLWTEERQYQEKEAKLSFALLLLALGKGKEADQFYHPSLPKDPFFAWLFQKNIKISSQLVKSTAYDLIEGNHCTYALTLNQNHVQAGALRSGKIMIPAFGPHSAPLSDSHLFGIKSLESIDGWFSSGIKDAWFQLIPFPSDCLTLHCIGVEPENPLFFVFYVRANNCSIAERQFKPKSLLRFSGVIDRVQFQQDSDSMEIFTDHPLTAELIPLSGGDSFWGATFLLAFRVPSVIGHLSFQIKKS